MTEVTVETVELPPVEVSVSRPEVTVTAVSPDTVVVEMVNPPSVTVEAPTLPAIHVDAAAAPEVAVSVTNPTVEVFLTGEGVPMRVIDFPVPMTDWVVDVGRSADVVVIDSAGRVVWPGEIQYGPGTMVTMRFSHPFSGKVHCYF